MVFCENIIADKAIQPRTQAGTSIPGLVNLLQSDWDGLMMEIHTLKQNLSVTRQELSQALYQHEAACRVIARLLKERNQAREDLAKLKGIREAAGEKMQIEGINENLKKKFDELSNALSEARRTRKPPTDLIKEDGLSKFKETESINVHTKAITSLKISKFNENFILTGGKDGMAHIYDLEKNIKVVSIEDKKKVTSVAFVKNSSLNTITCSSDGSANLWEITSDYTTKSLYTITGHTKSISACSVHPYNDYSLFFSKDGTWSLHNLPEKKLIQTLEVKDRIPICCGEVHPDGLMVGAGLKDGVVMVWDIRTQGACQETKLHTGPVTVLNYSEKGYQMITVGKNEGGVYLWDLRKLGQEEPLMIESKEVSHIKGAAFDQYGMYLGLCGDIVELYKVKNASRAAHMGQGPFTRLSFGEKNTWLAVGTEEGTIKIFK